MKRKAVLAITLTLLFIGMLTLAFEVQPVKAGETIYIRADGSIEGTTYIVSGDNVTYVFTANINDSIVVERSNIIIDGDGYALQGNGSEYGFYLSGITNVTIQNTNIENFRYGIRFDSSSFNLISGNNITANDFFGIDIRTYSNNNSICGNSITNNIEGISLWSSLYNSISGNSITNNNNGIGLYNSSNNTISGNNIINSSSRAIQLYSNSNNNLFCHNNVINNTDQVYSDVDCVNVWDNGYPSGGNYWSNYTGVDLNHDGIGDTSHVIDANNTDRYPLMGMFHSFNTSVGEYVNVVSNSTIEDFEYFESNSTIKMYVSNMTANQTHGFCRVSIPYGVMSEPFNVTIDGANPTYWNYTLYDNGTHRWIYFEYEHTTREIVIVPEFPSFIVLPLFMITTLLAVIIYRRKHST